MIILFNDVNVAAERGFLLLDLDVELSAREGVLDAASKLAHVKARDAYVAAFRRTYNAAVAESRDIDAALQGADEVAKQAYCNVYCVTFLTAFPKEADGALFTSTSAGKCIRLNSLAGEGAAPEV